MSQGKWFKKLTAGTITGVDFKVDEGKVGFTESPDVLEDAEANGHVKFFDTRETAIAFKDYLSSTDLFMRSYKTLNPGVDDNGNLNVVPDSLLDFSTGNPVLINGVPANLAVYARENVIPAPEVVKQAPVEAPVEAHVPAPKAAAPKVAAPDKAVEKAEAPKTEVVKTEIVKTEAAKTE
jgi:hypothetical protein